MKNLIKYITMEKDYVLMKNLWSTVVIIVLKCSWK